jgi:hypothetical protein
MLKVTQNDSRVQIETGGVIFEWDPRRGCQLTRVDFKSWSGPRPMLKDGQVAPNLTLDIGGRRHSLADVPAQVTFGLRTDERVVFNTRARIAGLFTVEQQYEVFREGVIFCEFGVFLDKGRRARVRSAEMRFPLDLRSVKNVRGHYMSREAYLKQDVTCIHVLGTAKVGLERDEKTNMDHLLSMYGLDLGWDESRYYSNRIEMAIEDSTSFGGEMLRPTRTLAGKQPDGTWQLTWKLCENSRDEVRAPFLYRNKWALFCGCARTEAGADADPARRNNVLGARICHVMYPYVREGKEWPWCSVPMRQTFYQDVQISQGNPSVSRVDEAARLGANVLILHQFWMKNGGSNGEPMANYQVYDPKWFKATVDRAHRFGMRVAVYMRGIEHYSLYSDFFERYLKKDWDGLYVDWASPFAVGFAKSSNKHSSIYNYFMYMRALRHRVGENGIMIAHCAIQSYISLSTFDAVMAGEFSVMHSGLLAAPAVSAAYAGMSTCGVHLIAGNSPDRAHFSSQLSAGFGAGLGYSHHPFMEPGKPFPKCNAYVQPLWDLFRQLGDTPVRVFNPAVGTERFCEWSHDALHPIAYRTASGKTLIMVTNLSGKTLSGSVDVDPAALGLPWSASIQPLKVKGTHRATVDGSRITLRNMPPYYYAGLLAG